MWWQSGQDHATINLFSVLWHLAEASQEGVHNTEPEDVFLFGDSGYALRSYLMTPYIDPVLPWQKIFNKAHKKTRCLVEHGI